MYGLPLQVHHLVVTSIDSEEAQERLAAIVATEAFVAVSRLFSLPYCLQQNAFALKKSF